MPRERIIVNLSPRSILRRADTTDRRDHDQDHDHDATTEAPFHSLPLPDQHQKYHPGRTVATPSCKEGRAVNPAPAHGLRRKNPTLHRVEKRKHNKKKKLRERFSASAALSGWRGGLSSGRRA